MKKLFKVLLTSLLALLMAFTVLACDNTPKESSPAGSQSESSSVQEEIQKIDYVEQLTFDANSGRIYQEVKSIKLHIDGDTTHFNLNEAINGSKVLKARYLAIDTPESTGKIEPYGKKASRFTKETLASATSIIIESDSATWNLDSTGDRVLSWVWYKKADSDNYRLLNLEILQEGLAVASNTLNNSYGTTCIAALNQAKALKLNVHSKEKDPEMYYGEAQELTLRELRTNIESYNGTLVAFEGVVTRFYNNGVYVEELDEESGLYNGIYVYYGFSFKQLKILKIGNRVRIVGSLQYWEGGGTYQVTDISYDVMDPTNPRNVQKISEGHSAAYLETSADEFKNGTRSFVVNQDGEEVLKTFSYAELAMNTSITMKNLLVKKCYTTTNPDTSSVGAFTLTCEVDGITIEVRTDVLYDADGNLVKGNDFIGKTITVKGFVDKYDGYQIKVLSVNDLIIQ